MLVQTANSVYEVHESEQVYRLVGHDPGNGLRALSDWLHYDRLGPVRTGEPLRIFVVREESGRVLDYRVVTTSPVTGVLAA